MNLCARIVSVGIIFSVVALLLPAGCGKKTDKDPKPPGTTGDPGGKNTPKDYELFASKDHAYHLRLKIDKESKTAHATIYDKDDAEVSPIDAASLSMNVGDKEDIELKAAASKPNAKVSHFMGAHDRLASAVNLEKTEIRATITGKQVIFKLDKDHD